MSPPPPLPEKSLPCTLERLLWDAPAVLVLLCVTRLPCSFGEDQTGSLDVRLTTPSLHTANGYHMGTLCTWQCGGTPPPRPSPPVWYWGRYRRMSRLSPLLSNNEDPPSPTNVCGNYVDSLDCHPQQVLMRNVFQPGCHWRPTGEPGFLNPTGSKEMAPHSPTRALSSETC